MTHTYPKDGIYYATCYVTDKTGNTQWQQVKILVNSEDEDDEDDEEETPREMVAYWSFDEIDGITVNDSSGNGHDGKMSAAAPAVVDGKFGKALQFNGSSNFVQVSDAPELRFGASDSFTIALWVKSAATSSGQWRAVIQKGRTASSWYGLWVNNNRFVFGGNGINMTSSRAYTANGWHHMVIVQDGATRTRNLFMDGNLVGSGASQGTTSTTDLFMGYSGPGVGEYYNGALDDVRMYNYAMNLLETRNLINGIDKSYTIGGKVSAETGIDVAGVKVNLLSADGSLLVTTATKKSGAFKFTGIPAGDYILSIPAVFGKYLAVEQAVALEDEDILNADITLEAEDYVGVSFTGIPADAVVSVYSVYKALTENWDGSYSHGSVKQNADGSFSVLAGSYNTYFIEASGYKIYRGEITVADEDAVIEVAALTPYSGAAVSLTEAEVRDHMVGGWVGQSAGVGWAETVEFNSQGRMMDESLVPVWQPSHINRTFNQDDVYVEVPFLDCMKDNGVNVRVQIFGDYFRDSTFNLWHANYWGRTNLRAGIPAPDSGHYSNNTCADDIDWQIEADSMGMMAVGQPNVAAEASWRAGHVMNYGDGVYGGVFVSAAYAAAYTASSVDEIVDAALVTIPVNTQFRDMMEDVLHQYKAGLTYAEIWRYLEDNWNNDRCPDGCSVWGDNYVFNIDAKMNAAYVLVGLLYGEGDFEESMRIAMIMGQDNDCNVATVGGILGAYYGLSNPKIDSKWYSALNWNSTKFQYTNYTFNDAVDVNFNLAKETLLLTGGHIEDGVWTIPGQTTAQTLIREQWPFIDNELPGLTASVTLDTSDPTGRTFVFEASATDEDGIADYQWFFGDMSFENGANLTHSYAFDGDFYATCYVTDSTGNTAWKQIKVEVIVNKDELAALIDEVTQFLATEDENAYAPYTWANLVAALPVAEAALNAHFGDYTAAYNALKAAFDGIAKKITGIKLIVQPTLAVKRATKVNLNVKWESAVKLPNLTVESNNPSVATVSKVSDTNGSAIFAITGIRTGSAVLKISANDGSGQVCAVLVTVS